MPLNLGTDMTLLPSAVALWFVASHMLGDYLFQNQWMADGKFLAPPPYEDIEKSSIGWKLRLLNGCLGMLQRSNCCGKSPCVTRARRLALCLSCLRSTFLLGRFYRSCRFDYSGLRLPFFAFKMAVADHGGRFQVDNQPLVARYE